MNNKCFKCTEVPLHIGHSCPFIMFCIVLYLIDCLRRFDLESNQDEQVHLDCFCVVASAIEVGVNNKYLNLYLKHFNMIICNCNNKT